MIVKMTGSVANTPVIKQKNYLRGIESQASNGIGVAIIIALK